MCEVSNALNLTFINVPVIYIYIFFFFFFFFCTWNAFFLLLFFSSFFLTYAQHTIDICLVNVPLKKKRKTYADISAYSLTRNSAAPSGGENDIPSPFFIVINIIKKHIFLKALEETLIFLNLIYIYICVCAFSMLTESTTWRWFSFVSVELISSHHWPVCRWSRMSYSDSETRVWPRKHTNTHTHTHTIMVPTRIRFWLPSALC